MKVHVLSSYSAERYFLLSEVEQKSRMLLVEENEASIFPVFLDSPMSVLYARWRPASQSVEDVCRSIMDLIPYVRIMDSSTCLVLIDAYIPNRNAWTGTDDSLKARLSKAIDQLQVAVGCSNVVIGLTDNLSGLPALEKLYDMIERVVPGYLSDFPVVADFVAINNQELMGHAPLLEADAQEGVFQLWCCSDDVAGEDNKFVLNVTSKFNASGIGKRAHGDTEKSVSKSPLPQVLLIALSLVVVLVSLFIKYV
jgi:hypothetical protein